MQGFPKFPSGPPIYIFDTKGQLVDWTPDEGDDGPFWRRAFKVIELRYLL
jgi:hypothetical protein